MTLPRAHTGSRGVKRNRSARLSRQSWIQVAFTTLVREGVDRVRVESLARNLGVTKGSFYWHFEDRTELLDGVLDYWIEEMTQSVLDHAAMFHGDPVLRIYKSLDEIIGKERAGFDPQFRAWAGQDARVKRRVDRIDRIRLSFLRGLFADAGFGTEAAEIRARLIYYYIIGEHFVTNTEPMGIRLRKLRQKVDLLVAGAARSQPGSRRGN